MKIASFWRDRRSLSIKLPLAVVALVYGVAFVSGITAQWRETRVVRATLEDGAKQLATSLALSNAENLVRLDYWALYSNLRRQVDALDQGMAPLLYGAIVDVRGTVMAHTQPERNRLGQPLAERDSFLSFASDVAVRYGSMGAHEALLASIPVEYGGKQVGHVWLAYDTGFIREKVRDSIIQIGLIATLLAVIGSISGWWLSRRMIRPLDNLEEAIDRIRSGKLAEVEPLSSNGQDEIGRVVAAFNDMAVQLKEKEALSSQLLISEKLAAVGRLVSGVAHEINNPLCGMRNAIDNLRLFSDDPVRYAESIHLLTAGLEHIGNVVEALLLQHRGQGRLASCDPHCLDDLYLLIRHECEMREIRVTWNNYISGSFLTVCTQLQQVLINLLVNAVSATPDRGQIAFTANETKTTLIFTVTDSGCGISREDMGRIFEPFYTTRPEGSGLGLWVSLQLVHAMGGTIEVDSREGDGTSFRVIIPQVHVDMVEKTNDESVAD